MSTVKFSNIEKLKEIQSRIYLKTKRTMTQQEILERAISVIDKNIDLIIEQLIPGTKKYTEEEITKFLGKSTNWGKDTKRLSKSIDQILYEK
ncbi:MAG: hypothetical protein HeimC3_32560 [Candidatus Heimdallarchaeota archaeon LC_3]|nr:MAG: hypothetical protein HeimC3_32560 [Candidatus Heimdallarchaeota archaeon LC_3]